MTKPTLKKKLANHPDYSCLVALASSKEDPSLFYLRVESQLSGSGYMMVNAISKVGIAIYFPVGKNSLSPYQYVFFPFERGELQQTHGLDWLVSSNGCYRSFSLDELIEKIRSRGRKTVGIDPPLTQKELGDRKI